MPKQKGDAKLVVFLNEQLREIRENLTNSVTIEAFQSAAIYSKWRDSLETALELCPSNKIK